MKIFIFLISLLLIYTFLSNEGKIDLGFSQQIGTTTFEVHTSIPTSKVKDTFKDVVKEIDSLLNKTINTK